MLILNIVAMLKLILLTTMLFTALGLQSCGEDAMEPANNKQSENIDIEKDAAVVVRESQNIFPIFSPIYGEDSLGGNKMTIGLDVVKDAGDVTINSQTMRTVIVGDQRWTMADYNQAIDLPDDFDHWSVREEFRWQSGTKLEVSKHLRLTVTKVKTNYYLHSLAMLLEEQIRTEGLVDIDELTPEYEALDEWHIPSTEESAEMISNLRWKEAQSPAQT